MTPSLVAHQLLLEDPEIRRCGFQTHPVRAGRFQMSQWGLPDFIARVARLSQERESRPPPVPGCSL
jgi:hypothetical protein